MKHILPDFKTERTDILPPLPSALKVVPVAFILSLLGMAAMAAYSLRGVEAANAEATGIRGQQAVEQGRIKALQERESALKADSKQAREVQSWIAGSTELYPLILKVARTVDPETNISELSLSRLEDNPSHVKMTLKLYSTHGAEQAEALTQAITDTLQLRVYSASTTPSDSDPNEVQLECNWAPGLALNDEK